MASSIITAYVLIVVSATGNVSAPRFQTLHLCEEAKSIAQTGMSLEDGAQHKTPDMLINEHWYHDHPARAPENEEERGMAKGEYSKCSNYGCRQGTEDHMIQDMPPDDYDKKPVESDTGFPPRAAYCFAETSETDATGAPQ